MRHVWERSLHIAGYAAIPAVRRDVIVVYERHTRLVCLDPRDGSVRWDVATEPWPREIVLAGDRVLVGGSRLRCLDLATGAELWCASTREWSAHAVVCGPLVLFGGWRGYTPVGAAELETGAVSWCTPARTATVLPAAWGDRALLGHGDRAWLVSPRDGARLHDWRPPEPLHQADLVEVFRVVDADRCLARTESRRVVELRLSTPEVRYVECPFDWPRVLPFLVAEPLGLVTGAGGRVHTGERRIYAIHDLGDGRVLMVTKGALRVVALEGGGGIPSPSVWFP
ncbi:outer membrane protein assembly factor BamB family protein [Herbidospora daliensis]|uniref:outer membrane protein assembly factor BamB family protein n=1 Tax=Herbidospora daliensis TaxID=295585 RepID=UPI000784CD10|nr:PQQ-binding-like beta-propeller repeat protein [Herbidospora daliensis]